MDWIKTAIFFTFVYFLYATFLGEESGCKKYASKYSCSYVEKKANYDVYYWFNVSAGNAQDEKFIGSAVGIYDCKNLAMRYASSNNKTWNDRSYICVLKKDGRNMEKHRLMYD
jgi:hypothetical protein